MDNKLYHKIELELDLNLKWVYHYNDCKKGHLKTWKQKPLTLHSLHEQLMNGFKKNEIFISFFSHDDVKNGLYFNSKINK